MVEFPSDDQRRSIIEDTCIRFSINPLKRFDMGSYALMHLDVTNHRLGGGHGEGEGHFFRERTLTQFAQNLAEAGVPNEALDYLSERLYQSSQT